MVLDSHRQKADVFLEPIAIRMKNVNPNTISWIAFLCAIFAGVGFWLGDPVGLFFALVFLVLSSFLDALDGKIARMTGKASKKGDFLDHLLDRYADIFIVGGILLSPAFNTALAFLAIVGVLMTSYVGTQAQAVGAGRDYGGILGRADRLVILILFTVLQLIAIAFGSWGVAVYGVTITFIDVAMIIFAIGGNVTAIQRAVSAWRKL
ncbi:MAG: CDP-alcohol phosphatidyltransferase family protein [Thermoplasmata archaeon]|nr:CDP-alcohol phosphatidyltransferase family protein [Thermoplasmata archaeon]